MKLFEGISQFYNDWFQPRLYGLSKKTRKKSGFESWDFKSQCWVDYNTAIAT